MNPKKHLHKNLAKPISERRAFDEVSGNVQPRRLDKAQRIFVAGMALLESIHVEIKPKLDALQRMEISLSTLRGHETKGYVCKPCHVCRYDKDGNVISRKAFPAIGLDSHAIGRQTEHGLEGENCLGFALLGSKPVETVQLADMPEQV
jgi:hypothetical protein